MKDVCIPKRLGVWGKELVSCSFIVFPLSLYRFGSEERFLLCCWSSGVVEAEMEREVLLVSLSNMPLGHSCEFFSLSEAFDFWGLCRY